MKSATSHTEHPFRADLHSHTTCSDGTFTPVELVRLAVESGLSGLSITDHDTVEAYGTAIQEATRLGLELLPGIEFSSRDTRESVHVLGYGFDLDDENMRFRCEQRVEQRMERNAEILELLSSRGMAVTQEEIEEAAGVADKRVFGRPHIARVMQDKGYVGTMREAFDNWIGEGKPCYRSGREISVQETISLIRGAGGYAVIAHPHLLRHQSTIKRLLSMNFDGLEGYYATAHPNVEQRWINRGRDRGWIITGGSDFHGTNKPYISLGCSWIDEATFRKLQSPRS